MKSKFVSLVALLALTVTTLAEEVDLKERQKNAIKNAQDTLKDPAAIKKIAENDKMANMVHTNTKDIAGSDENAHEMYSISADLLPILMEMNHDNPDKALESLSAYSRDPGAFLKSMPGPIRERIEKLSKKIESEKPKAKP